MTTTSLAGCLGDSALDPVPPLSGESIENGDIRTASIHTPEGIRIVTYEVIDGEPVAGGDIVLPREVLRTGLRSAPAANIDHWLFGSVPYEIDPALPTPQRVHDAIAHYQRYTAVRLVPRANQADYVRFVPSAECSSRVGRQGGPQDINLSPGCGTGSVIHEIAHALGIWHEQSRFDRNDHVIIHWENIESGKEHNFDMESVDGSLNYGPYDFGSIMHYSSFAFSTGTGPTITLLDGTLIPTQRSALSNGDLRALDSMHPVVAGPAPAMCRTAPPRGALRRASVAEVWGDVGPASSFAMHVSTGTSFLPPVAWATRDGGFDVNNRWAVGDYDGDGRQDLVAVWNDAGQNTLTLRRSSGSSLSHEHWAIRRGTWLNSTQWVPGDFDGDGRTDIVGIWNDGGQASFAVYRSTGAGFAAHTQWLVRDGGWADTIKWNVGDFNNDGRDDLLAAWNDGGATTLTVRLSTGSTFFQQHWAVRQGGWANDTQWLTGNFDGSGGSDAVAVWNDGGFATLTMYPSTGTSFAPARHWAIRDGGWASNIRWRAADFDADRRTDVLAAWNDGGMSTLTVRRSTGAAFTQQHWAVRRAGWHDSTSWCPGTFTSLDVAPLP
jgi:hypothetical protein